MEKKIVRGDGEVWCGGLRPVYYSRSRVDGQHNELVVYLELSVFMAVAPIWRFLLPTAIIFSSSSALWTTYPGIKK